MKENYSSFYLSLLTFHFSLIFMLEYSEPVAKLIDEFKRLPGVGNKSAQRLAFHILRLPEEKVKNFVEALQEVKEKIVFFARFAII